MSRKTSKENREEKARREKARREKARREKALQAEIAMAIKAPPPKTGSAADPPYLFTCICPDPDRREAKYAPIFRIHKTMRK